MQKVKGSRMPRSTTLAVLLLLLAATVCAAPPINRLAHDLRETDWVYTSGFQPNPESRVANEESKTTGKQANQNLQPMQRQQRQQQVISTLTGYLTQAVNSVTGVVTNQVSGYLPITVNVPDLFTGVVNRVTTGYQYVQQTWQTRPSLQQLWQNRPTLFAPQPVVAEVEKPEYGPLVLV